MRLLYFVPFIFRASSFLLFYVCLCLVPFSHSHQASSVASCKRNKFSFVVVVVVGLFFLRSRRVSRNKSFSLILSHRTRNTNGAKLSTKKILKFNRFLSFLRCRLISKCDVVVSSSVYPFGNR